MKKIILLLVTVSVFATAFRNEQIMITGIVTDESGTAVPFVTVTGGTHGNIGDPYGAYSTLVDTKQTTLTFSATGFNSVKVQISGRRIINVVMKRNSTELTCVVVTTAGLAKSRRKYGYQAGSSGQMQSGKYSFARMPKRPTADKDRDEESNTEEYGNIVENNFRRVTDEPLSTFSIDVDAASYSNVRRFLNNDELPPAGAVRAEEMVNYFKYQYPQPLGKDPFSINTEISDCPWNSKNKLVLIGLQGKNIPVENLPAANLVFLIDVSGSMMVENKLPLVKASMKLLTDQLRDKDHISIVVYAGNAGLVLPATSGNDKMTIKNAIDALEAGGSTAGGAGIRLAYKTAQENFINGGNNRVILCTDGDFNVGASSDDDMVQLIEEERSKNIFLTVLGYGVGNYKDSKMEQLADKGNGNHAYIDGINEAKKVLVNEFGGTLFTIAKDVKLQVEFNPSKVAGYRLIGYENRLLNKEDFNDDKKDAGELGSGHTVTALYEIIPAGVKSEFLKAVDPLKYQKRTKNILSSANNEMLTIKFRYKAPDKDKSGLIVHPVTDTVISINNTTDNFRFASSVAGFAMLLRNSEYKGNNSFEHVIKLANASLGKDAEGYRKEFVSLVEKAKRLNDQISKK